jgi:CheY-like chemotaxis protein
MELLQIVKADPKISHLPIIMLSSLEGSDITEKLFEYGALGVMKKPFDEMHFLELVRKCKKSL